MGAAAQGTDLLLLEIGQREGGGTGEVDLAVEHDRIAGGAFPLLAAVHQLQALAEGPPEDGLVLVDLELDSDRLEPDRVLLTHLSPGPARSWRSAYASLEAAGRPA